MLKDYLKEHLSDIRKIKTVLAVLLALMILVDVVLVFLGPKGIPTYSAVIDDHQNEFIWLSFLYGGLVAKVFYNRQVTVRSREVEGSLAFAAMVFLLYLLGRELHCHKIPDLGLWHQLLLLVTGGFLAYRVWPQYRP